jgi:hypothetical protein
MSLSLKDFSGNWQQITIRPTKPLTRLLENHEINQSQLSNRDYCGTSNPGLGPPHSRPIPPFWRSWYPVTCPAGAVPRRNRSSSAKTGLLLRHELLSGIKDLLLSLKRGRGPGRFRLDCGAGMPGGLRPTPRLARIACGRPGSQRDCSRSGCTVQLSSRLPH